MSPVRFPFAMHTLNQHDMLVHHEGFHPEMVLNISINWHTVVTLLEHCDSVLNTP